MNKKYDMLFTPEAQWPHLAYSWLCGAACRLDSLKCHRMRYGLEVTKGMEKSPKEELEGIIHQVATSFDLLQRWQYNTMKVVFLPSLFPAPGFLCFFIEKISSNDVKIKFTSEEMSLPVYNSWELQTISLVFFKPANKERRGWDLMSQNVNRNPPCFLHAVRPCETGSNSQDSKGRRQFLS